ncbi:putative ATPase NDAI_0G01950 [Naumovozyma dairenensis CBS 421]|uniref:Irc5p n=1 Tax=Naumovozyma dairenensis (strain ATCC 10597 / BCRC 20456 / CBS 421 / NBRC 0211 / NRRL Y-12639) TaxID=1071378 RepID=G0WDV9_NAUDC|nr:hypothetical protein NDAI_0G01950 [Naumovozyma dairenensis CBS 421]CCD25970.2 hypothetical protein NDAI_0G01950 [Naumovozyma dairenensis CBS 421]
MVVFKRKTRFSRRSVTPLVDYKEKEVSDLTPDVLNSDSDTAVRDGNDAINEPIWLHDDLNLDSDIQLDSDADTGGNGNNDDDESLDNLLKSKNERDKEHQDDDNSGADNTDESDTKAVSLKLKKLNEFVTQSQVYSGIIADTLLKRTNELEQEKNTADPITGEEDNIEEPPKKKAKTSILDFFRKKEKKEIKEEVDSKEVLDDETISKEQPHLLKNCILKPYQLEGLNWLITLYENGLNGILADDMGLGKTIQSIALLAFIYEMDTEGPFLIAAPLSTIDNWMNEFQKFAPDLPVLKYYHHGGQNDRTKLLRKFFKKTNGTGIIVTSYEIIIRDSDFIMSKNWKFLIVDEGHRLKNINCKLIKELKKINTSNKLLLTGTPLQNNLSELWSLLNFIMPNIFADFEIFSKWFDFEGLNLQSNSMKLNKMINDELQKNLISNLHTILKPFLLRRLKKTVLADILPPKREYVVNCPLTSIQKKFYTRGLTGKLKKTIFKEYVKTFFTMNAEYIGKVSNKSIREFIDCKLGEDETLDIDDMNDTLKSMDLLYQKHIHPYLVNKRLQNMMMQLRQIVDSTLIFYFPYLHPEDLTLEILLKSSGKLQTLQKLIIPLIKAGHKTLIFSQFTNMLDLLEDWCELNSLRALRIDGSVDTESRKDLIEQFNKKSGKKQAQVFLLSTRAAGLGINLTAADTVVLFDSDWNPQVDLQAMDRCHRIGQEKPVIVYRLCCDNTLEHVILTRAANKRKLERLVIQMGKFNTLKKLALNEGSFLNQAKTEHTSNKELVEELSQLLMSNQSSIGFTRANDKISEELSDEEIKELTDRSLEAYKPDRQVDLPHVRLFETTSGF